MELIDDKKQINYRAAKARNQSALKELMKSPGAYLKSLEPRTGPTPDYFVFGSAVDCLLTTPEDFTHLYAVMDFAKPSDTIVLVMDTLLETISNLGEDARNVKLENWEEMIVSVAHGCGYGKAWKPETVANKVRSAGEDYFYFIAQAEGKDILDVATYMRIEKVAEAFLNNEFTKKLLTTKTKYQVAIYWKHLGKDCKVLLDALNIDETNKTVQPIDIKTTGDSVYRFNSSVFKFRYDIQAAFYTDALKAAYPGYTILPFKFIVSDKFCYDPPLIYTCTENDLNVGRKGMTLASGNKIKGYVDLMAELNWHEQSGIWDYKMDYYINGGEFKLDLNNEEGKGKTE